MTSARTQRDFLCSTFSESAQVSDLLGDWGCGTWGTVPWRPALSFYASI